MIKDIMSMKHYSYVAEIFVGVFEFFVGFC